MQAAEPKGRRAPLRIVSLLGRPKEDPSLAEVLDPELGGEFGGSGGSIGSCDGGAGGSLARGRRGISRLRLGIGWWVRHKTSTRN
jgi:hypothetical protein